MKCNSAKHKVMLLIAESRLFCYDSGDLLFGNNSGEEGVRCGAGSSAGPLTFCSGLCSLHVEKRWGSSMV